MNNMREGDTRLRVFARHPEYSRRLGILICQTDWQGNIIASADQLTLVARKEGEFIEPTFRADNDAAQELMDELWKCGLRPSEGSGSAGSLAATERHLTDMRKIVSGVKKP